MRKIIILRCGQDLPGLLLPREGSQKNSSQLFHFQDGEFTAVLCRSLMCFFLFYFLFFPFSFKLLPLCTSELCWSQRSNRLKTCVQVKWLHLWPQTIPPWECLICSNQMYFYFNGMLFAWGKLCGSPSDVFSFYHFVEKCINPFCFTSGFFFNTALGFSLLSAALPMPPVQKKKKKR